MFRASSAHLQEDIVVYMQHMVPSLSIRVPGGLSIRSYQMSNVFVIIKMCYVHNQWYDISCAPLYMYVCVCVCVYIYIYIYIYIYGHVWGNMNKCYGNTVADCKTDTTGSENDTR